jgi:hypothetical protein
VENKESLSTQATVSDRIKLRARREVWSYAVFRPESAAVIAGTALAMWLSTLGLPWFPGTWWLWLGGGLIAEGAIALSTLRDKAFYERLLGKMFTEQFNIGALRSEGLQAKLNKALQYRALIVEEIHRRDDFFDERLLATVRGMEEWIAQIYRLSISLDTYLHDPIIARDFAAAPKDLRALEAQREHGLTESVRNELEKTIEMKQAQVSALQDMNARMSRAQLQLDNTLAAMGTVYMQAKVLGSKDVDNSRAQRMRQDMVEQVRALEDTTQAMDEIYRTNLGSAAG